MRMSSLGIQMLNKDCRSGMVKVSLEILVLIHERLQRSLHLVFLEENW